MSQNFKNSLNYILAILIITTGAVLYIKDIKDIKNIKDKNVLNTPKNTVNLELNYEDALKKAKKDNQNVLLVFGAEWCEWCKKLENTTLKDKEVIKNIEKHNLIEIHIDIDKRTDLAEKYYILSVPVVSIIDHKETEKKKNVGFLDSKAFIDWLNK